jgi:2-amino-4-hydroxy-6-hydroxymethyldihydropteridine diphosphokinase
MNFSYLSLGSNQKNPERQLRLAIKAIKSIPSTSVLIVSSFYWNKAWGLHTQQDFCNAMVKIQTLLTPHQLLKYCHFVEHNLGRVRKKHWGPRSIDIDIILYADRSVKTKSLTIPHPFMLARLFVLKPLLEINPEFSALL